MGVRASKGTYAEIKLLLGIPEDEPIFILRAQDSAARLTLVDYAWHAGQVGASLEFVAGVDKVADDFAKWHTNPDNMVKVPD